MFENALWQSRSHSKQPLYLIIVPMIVFMVGIPFSIHFFGLGLIFGIDVCLALVFLAAIIVFGRRFKWNNNKLLFAVLENGIYFTVVNNANASYFQEDFSNIKGYSYVQDGEFHNVTVYFNEPAHAGVFGKIKFIKMIKVENIDKFQEVMGSFSIPVIQAPERK